MNIHIEFCEKWNYRPDFDRVSKLIKKIAPTAKIEGNAKPPRSGAFEVSFDKKLVYSKFKTGEFPQEGDIKSWFWCIREVDYTTQISKIIPIIILMYITILL